MLKGIIIGIGIALCVAVFVAAKPSEWASNIITMDAKSFHVVCVVGERSLKPSCVLYDTRLGQIKKYFYLP